MGVPIEISDADITAYEQDGVVCLRGVFSTEWIDLMRGAVEDAMAAPGPFAEDYADPASGGRFFGDLDVWKRHAAFRKFVLESPAAEVAGGIMRSGTSTFFYDQLLVKEGGTAERTPWHQDQPYWAVSGRQVASLWVPFDPVPKDVSVEYVAGSHLWQAHNPYHFSDGTPYEGTDLPPLPEIEGNRGDYRILSFALEPGDCLVFQAMVVHGAPGNPYKSRRRALATRWLGDDARVFKRKGEVAIPTTDPGFAHGERYRGEDYPTVWRSY
ncbi:phytanoyl-CoA dioxygenase family protein [Hwanghaeella sp.]|uniref:phytanoyl-CoA dioxygenase family protein n=1 Tax=Hwanghaeella sp. TaxID=2605943 RepID=UPI003CCB7C81